MCEEISSLRKRIEEIDQGIIRLIAERIEIGKEVGKAKIKGNLPMRDLDVESKVVGRYVNKLQEIGMSEISARNIASILISETLEAQYKLKKSKESMKLLIVGGAGKMGGLLCNYFAKKGHEVFVFDRSKSSRFPNVMNFKEAVRVMDFIIVATPISSVRGILEETISSTPKGVVFDISSIKNSFVDLLKNAAKDGHKVCSVHPMFGPFVPSFHERNIIVCDCGCKEAVDATVDLFEGSTARIIRMSIDDHDRMMAYVLGMTHALNIAFLRALARSGYDMKSLKEVASTTFSRQLSTSSDVASEDANLYYEIQHCNPYNGIAVRQLISAMEEIRKAGENEDSTGFIDIMQSNLKYLEGGE
ncbi:MAG: bifunctional chorismate mutase/prephenate dehydrogenase [Methanomassiliicoccales archaeon]